MANSRKQLSVEIAKLEKTLRYQQSKTAEHKKYLIGVVKDYKVIFLILFLPSFFLGWKIGRGKWFGPMLRQLIEVGMLAAASYFKKQLISVFR